MSCSIDQKIVDLSCSINEELGNLSKASNNQFIFRVRQSLRKENEEAYEPEMLSIGPYHYGKKNLQKMNEYKLKYLQGILERQGEENAQRYIAALWEKETIARDCYAEHLDMNPDDFVKMMLLDGCFIIEFLRRYQLGKMVNHEGTEVPLYVLEDDPIFSKWKDDPIFSNGGNLSILRRDLLLFENQLPFFILELLFNMTKIERRQEDLIDFSILLLEVGFVNKPCFNKKPENVVLHLLGLMHESSCSSFAEAMDTQEEGGHQRCFTQLFKRLQSRRDEAEDTQEEGGQQRYVMQFFNRLQSRRDQVEDPRHTDTQEGGHQRCFTQFFRRLQRRRDQVEDPRHTDTQEEGGHQRCFTQFFKRRHSRRDQGEAEGRMVFIKSVRELKQYGIEFREANQSGSWLDIKFENGIMQIPNLEVDDGTESLLRNLIAYEQYMPHLVGCRVVSDYTTVIDCLINSSEDVQWLCHNKIITNWLGSDEEISKIFNKSGNGVFLNSQHFSYRKLFKDVNEHCSKRRHAWIADLKKKYFHNPWSIISFLAAIFLLLLTLIQTVIAVLQVAKETNMGCNYKW